MVLHINLIGFSVTILIKNHNQNLSDTPIMIIYLLFFMPMARVLKYLLTHMMNKHKPLMKFVTIIIVLALVMYILIILTLA